LANRESKPRERELLKNRFLVSVQVALHASAMSASLRPGRKEGQRPLLT
jgi:hypothetical protein